MTRTQITLRPSQHRAAKARAAQLGVSLAEYIRRLIDRDLAGPSRRGRPDAVFDLGDSDGSDVARHRDDYVGTAVATERRR